MALTSYGVNNALAVKLWSRGIEREALKRCYVSRFIGTSSNSLIQRKSETQKSPGDQITIGLRMQLSGSGVIGDGTLEDNEEALTTYSDALIINQMRHAVRSQGKMSEQRIPFEFRDEAMSGLADWWADYYDTCFFNHVCGYTVANSDGSLRTAGNTIVAPTASTRYLFATAGSVDEDMSSTDDVLTLGDIDNAVETAKTATPLIRPVMVMGEPKYVMFIHPYQTTSIRTNTDTGQWLDIQKAAMQGGMVSKNPIYTGALGEYNGVVLHESTRVTQGITSTTGAALATTRRAVLCGAQSAFIGFGRGDGRGQNFSWKESLFDYDNQLGVSAGAIVGMKKALFNSTDFGTIVVTSYATSGTA